MFRRSGWEHPEIVKFLDGLGLPEDVLLQECSLPRASCCQRLEHFLFAYHKLKLIRSYLRPSSQEEVISALFNYLGPFILLLDHRSIINLYNCCVLLRLGLVCSRHLFVVSFYNLSSYCHRILLRLFHLLCRFWDWHLWIKSLVDCQQVCLISVRTA